MPLPLKYLFASAIGTAVYAFLVVRVAATLRTVLLWCLPTYAAVGIALLSNAWMVVALFLSHRNYRFEGPRIVLCGAKRQAAS
jgi:hypothetical protein